MSPFRETHDGPVEVRHMQPYEAVKPYRCPGCNHEIQAGLGHKVVVPTLEPDLRRHWHTGCWHREERRREGKSPTQKPTQRPAKRR